jgi:hypothetical protein
MGIDLPEGPAGHRRVKAGAHVASYGRGTADAHFAEQRFHASRGVGTAQEGEEGEHSSTVKKSDTPGPAGQPELRSRPDAGGRRRSAGAAGGRAASLGAAATTVLRLTCCSAKKTARQSSEISYARSVS